MERAKCHDCDALEGELHQYGCDMERCPFCGNQLISCGCCYEILGLYDSISYGSSTAHLPPNVYKNGLPPHEQEIWMMDLCEKGRVPWVKYPNICCKCGELWPDIFMVPNGEWTRYVQPDMRGEVLCRECYDFIKSMIDEHYDADWVFDGAR